MRDMKDYQIYAFLKVGVVWERRELTFMEFILCRSYMFYLVDLTRVPTMCKAMTQVLKKDGLEENKNV